jgi:MFS superfamily sulfate permease-like transporter
MPQYKLSYFQGDFLAALTMASFYIPMALSLASNLAHVPPLNGLYAFVFNPLIYGFLGTCPQMVVGPEAAGSLLTGQVVKENINRGNFEDDDGRLAAEVAGVVTFTAGLVIFMAGIFRLGFLDNVLSRPFQRGFISAIGIVIFVDQLIPELGLTHVAAEVGGVVHGSCLEKTRFLITHLDKAHGLTTAVSLGSFAIIMVCREIKNHLQPYHPSVAYVPDRFLIVVLAAILCWAFRWDEQGLEVLGDVKTNAKIFPIHWPYSSHMHLKYAADAFSTSFIIALLGFFESSVAAKSLAAVEQGPPAIHVHRSANRELVALGTANVVGGLFMALPAFGGYGRSKVNASTGGKTPMSSIILAFLTLMSVLFLTPYFYYLPVCFQQLLYLLTDNLQKGVLCAMISVVAYSLLEEIPPDLLFFIKIRGWSELLLMALIFFSTILWNLNMGIAVGIGLSILRVIRHATRPRIQILGRVPGTIDKFENAERAPGRLEFFEGCLIVKVPEPLTFANTGDLRERLRRLEDYHHSIALNQTEGLDLEMGPDRDSGSDDGGDEIIPVERPLPSTRSSFAVNSFSGPSGQSASKLVRSLTGKSLRGPNVRHRFVIFDVHGVTSMDGAGAQVVRDIVQTYVNHDVRVIFCRVPAHNTRLWTLFEDTGLVELCGGRESFVDSVQDALAIAEKDRREAMVGEGGSISIPE